MGRIARHGTAGLAVIALAAIPVAAADESRTPRLRVAGVEPVQVRGTGFARYERVRVTVRTADAERRVRVRATRRGTFAPTFDGLVVDRCASGLHVRARGGRGSRAELKQPQLQCPPPLRPGRG